MAPPAARLPTTPLVAAASLGAALVHATAAGSHSDDRTLVWLFAATAAVQAALGVAVLRSPTRWVLMIAAGANLTAAATWAASRIVGLPWVESLAGVEPVGLQDLAAAALGAVAGLGSLLALRGPLAGAGLTWWPVIVLPVAMVGMSAPHAHDHGSNDHGHAVGSSALHDHEGTGDHDHVDPDHPDHAAVDPRLAGADTAGVSAAELEAAVALVGGTREALGSSFADPADAAAAGYVWIGDGRRVGGFQHYVHHGLLADGRTLDPTAVESLVYENTPDGPVLVSAMYLLGPGSTMDDVPDVAGQLTVWHDHQNLCWDPGGTRLAGVLVDGRCRPGGELRATPPMLHVWLVDHECGPFAGIEGHGEGCAAHDH